MLPGGLYPSGAAMASREDLAALLAAREMGQLDRLEQIPGQSETINRPVRKVVGGLAQGAADAFTFPGRYARGETGYQPGQTASEQPEAAQFAPSTALGMMMPGRGVGLGSGPGRIKTYHSSPHDFDRFDISKLRTGQGAATYGEGIYLAENPKVSGRGGEYWKEFAQHPDVLSKMNQPHERIALEFLTTAGGDRKKAIGWLEETIKNVPAARQREAREAAIELLKSDKQVGPRTYEVAIKGKPEEFLNWDEPILKQSPQLQKAVAPLLTREPTNVTRGADVYRNLAASLGEQAGEKAHGRPHWTLSSLHTMPDKWAASQALTEAGVPGIRYLDQGSRPQGNIVRVGDEYLVYDQYGGTGGRFPTREAAEAFRNPAEKTYNYVVPDPGRLEVLKKYAIPGLLTGGAANEAMRDQPY